jgi:Polypeptide deformylase
VGTEVPARCLQHETDHLDGVLFSDRMDAATRKLARREIQSIKVAYADEDEQASEGWPHTLTSGAGDRTPVYVAPEAAGNWAEVRVLARNDSFDRGGWLPCGTELRGRYAACHDGCPVAD